ncbi:MAG TPA: WbqC family protein [Bacteroidia bacterium]|nr:WbqC family protein [Bacteroidia bacterium]
MIVAIHQPNYLPWLGYFHKMKKADGFIFLDNVQIPGKGLSNRNYIKGKDGAKVMLSVPLNKSKGVLSNYLEAIPDYSKKWQFTHLNKIKDAYIKAPFFEEIFPLIEQSILNTHEHLCALNVSLILSISKALDINTKIYFASSLLDKALTKNERNLDLCKQLNATIYLSGQGAKKYNDEALFLNQQINIHYQAFVLPPYTQVSDHFMPNLSVLDTLFNLGIEETKRIIET